MSREKGRREAGRTDEVLLFLLAVAAGFVNWRALSTDPFLSHPIIDAAEYLAGARAIAAGLPFWEAAPIHGPVYSIFLLPFVLLFRFPLPPIYLFQILLTACAALLVRSAGTCLGGRRLGNTAGVLLAVAPPLLYFQVQILPVIVQVFLHALLLRLLLSRRGGRRAPLAAGVCGGLSYLTHPGAAIALVLILLFLVARGRPRMHALLFAAGLVIPLIPVSLLDARAGEGPFPITGNAGLNVYVGNGPGSDGTAHVRPGYAWERLTAMPLLAGKERSIEASRFFLRKTARAFHEKRLPFLRRLAAKALLFATGFPIDASQDVAYFRERSLLLRLFFLNAGLVVPLAFGFLLTGSSWRGRWPLAGLGFVGVWAATTLTVFAVRYRAPAWPFLVLPASAFLLSAPSLPRKSLLRGVVAALVLLLVAQSDPFGYRGKNPVRTAYNRGRLLYDRSDLEGARRLFLRLWDEDRDPDAANAIGVVEMAEHGKEAAAETWFRRAIERAPDYADARFNLALHLLARGRTEAAKRELDEAIRLSPAHAPALYTKGILLEREGDLGGAERFYREALRRDPTRHDTWTALGVLLARRGEEEEAVRSLRRALRLAPGSPKARRAIERLGR